MMDWFNALILADRRVIIENISEQQEISVGAAYKIVHDDLVFLRSVVIFPRTN